MPPTTASLSQAQQVERKKKIVEQSSNKQKEKAYPFCCHQSLPHPPAAPLTKTAE